MTYDSYHHHSSYHRESTQIKNLEFVPGESVEIVFEL